MANYSGSSLPKRQGHRTVPMEVLCMSMGRSGTTSFMTALELLGYNVYHGWNVFDDGPGRRKLLAGLKAKYLNTGPRLTKSDFEFIFGPYSATGGDIPSIAFADELIAAYPDAKVVIVQRDTDSWVRSLQEVLEVTFNPVNDVLGFFDPWFMGEIVSFFQISYTGFFKGSNKQEIAAVGGERYNLYYNHIRAIVPKEKLLDFKITQGWGPLCEFLGKEVPPQPFPWLNEKGELKKREAMYQRRSMRNMAVNAGVVFSGILALWWIYTSLSRYATEL